MSSISFAMIGSRKMYPVCGLVEVESDDDDDASLKEGAESEDDRPDFELVSDAAREGLPRRCLFDPFRVCKVLAKILIALVYLPEMISPAASVLNRKALLS